MKTQKPVVLYISNYAGFLGANRSLYQLILELKKEEQITPIVLLPCAGLLSDKLDAIGVKVITHGFYFSVVQASGFKDRIKGVCRSLWNFTHIFKIFFKIRKYNINIIHTNTSVVDIGVYLSIMMKVKHVWHIREFAQQHYHFKYSFGEKIARLMYAKGADRIIVISEALRLYYSKFVEPSNIIKIYNGLNIEDYAFNDVKQTKVLEIALVGLLHPSKHQDIVINAISILVHQYNISCIHLHIFGNSSSVAYFSDLKNIVTSNSLENYVTFHGYVDNMVDVLSHMHVGVLASEFEAFGRVTIEYMLSKMIAVVSDSGANTELVVNGVTGYVFTLNDIQGLSRIIYHILDNPNERSKIISTAYNYAVENFSSSINAKRIFELYSTLLIN